MGQGCCHIVVEVVVETIEKSLVNGSADAFAGHACTGQMSSR